MELHRKAFYNLLRMNARDDKNIQAENWQIEDLRELLTHQLFARLQLLGVALDEESFLLYADNYSTPEDLATFLSETEENKDKIFLLIFELWRRSCPDKQSVSIFCDELDFRISLYEEDPATYDQMIQSSLIQLEEILEASADEGTDPKTCFDALDPFCAHDVETFLYGYISTQIDTDNYSYAAELLDIFYPFVTDELWFDLLHVRLLVGSDPHAANVMIKNILAELSSESDLELVLEVADFLVAHGDPHLFQQAVKQALGLIKVEDDFQELIAIVSDYYQCLDKDKEDQHLQALLEKRAHIDLAAPIKKDDEDVIDFQNSLPQLVRSLLMEEK